MTLDELRERIKNELVLHEGNVADWQWTRTGLPAEATELGITDFFRLVDDVTRPLNAQFGKILDLQTTIRKVAGDSGKKLSDVQIGGFALDAERLGLSRGFVTEQWVPRLLAQIPGEPAAEKQAETAPLTPVQPTEGRPSESTDSARPGTLPPVATETAETIAQKVRDILDDYKEHIPAQAIRALFRAITYDEKGLADAVLTYLQANFYASETEPTGNSLREKLGSTDWRHLVWWDRQPAAQAGQTVATTGTNQPGPLPSPPPAAGTSAPVQKSGSSGLRDFLVALLIAGGLIAFGVVLIHSGRSADNERITGAVVDTLRREESARTQPAARKPKRKRTRSNEPPAETNRRPGNTTPPREEPYDELLNDVGQYGERPATKNGQWGLWRKGRWMVLPEYDRIEVYKDGLARVTVNGNSYNIDRSGNRIR